MSLLQSLVSLKEFLMPLNPKQFGILGMNSRNIDYILNYNERQYYPMVDNKLLTKKMANEALIAVPELYQTAEFIHDIDNVLKQLPDYKDGFVIKPVAGAGGGGIIVIKEVRGHLFLTSGGIALTKRDLAYHMSNILAGLYSLGGRPDQVMIEKRINQHPIFDKISYKGVPDVRVIVFKGYPIMAMLRLPTRESDGKANLHVGGIGVGVNLKTGMTTFGILKGQYISKHIDTHELLGDIALPDWEKTLHIAARIGDILPLGYIGCDFIYDSVTGTNLLEVNARPGLAVQIANKEGLKPRLEKISSYIKSNTHKNYKERTELAQDFFA
ncbi:MAG: alpha-L-glutamate ligase-like protein [Alphaproteobacteria bacterium]|jgi:alpha-L-glutamate ligase-like protein